MLIDYFSLTAGVVGLGVGLAMLGVGVFVARRNNRSMRSLSDAARHLSEGELDYQAHAPATTESRALASALNRMTDTLKGNIQTISGERNKLSAVLATMADGVMVVEEGGEVVMANPAAVALFNVRNGPIEGRTLAEAVRDHTVLNIVSRCFSMGHPQVGEVELLRPRKVLSVAATPLAGKISSEALLTVHDLTRLRQAENSQKEFVSNVSHELRNPLASVKAMVETLEAGAVEEKEIAQDFLNRINQDIDRMNQLVEDLLELSRLESGQLTLRLARVDLAALVKEIRASFEGAAKEQNIALEDDVPDGLPEIRADYDRLRQVLINLVENGLRFTQPGGTLTLVLARRGDSLEFQVRDTGVGIAAEHLPHIFERFYKVERSRRDRGTGLGLAIVQQIIEAHGGQVAGESREGLGSTFSFTVPLP